MKRLPAILIYFRLIAGIALPLFALAGISKLILAAILVSGFLSDIFDGVLARKLQISNLSLRRADTRADICFIIGSGFTIYIIDSSIATEWIPWIFGYLGIFIFRNLIDYFRYKASPSYHMWSGKIWALLLFSYSLISILELNGSILIPIAFAVYSLNALEGIVATIILSRPYADIPSLWHAFRLTRSVEQGAAANP